MGSISRMSLVGVREIRSFHTDSVGDQLPVPLHMLRVVPSRSAYIHRRPTSDAHSAKARREPMIYKARMFKKRIRKIGNAPHDLLLKYPYRRGTEKGYPSQAVDVRKQRILSRCALYYLMEKEGTPPTIFSSNILSLLLYFSPSPINSPAFHTIPVSPLPILERIWKREAIAYWNTIIAVRRAR